MKKRATYQVITEVKSAPVGVDWLMVMAARQLTRRQLGPQRQSDEPTFRIERKKNSSIHTENDRQPSHSCS